MNDKPAAKNNVTWFNGYLTREDREKLHGHKGVVICFTGLSASGKSTIAPHLEKNFTIWAAPPMCSIPTMSGTVSAMISVFRQRTGKSDREENVRRETFA